MARRFSLLIWGLCAPVLLARESARAVAVELPPAASRQVDFAADIKPLLGRCVQCHARGQRKGGLQIETRETLLKGGDSGPALIEGKSGASHLIELVAAADAESRMPPEGEPLTAEQVGLLRAWIDQGAPWEEGFHFPRGPVPAPLAPRKVTVPPAPDGSISNHPLDRLLAAYLASQNVTPTSLVDDRTFARRAYLDLIGLLPTPAEVHAFEADTDPHKRELLARRLLDDRRRYTEHWLTFWNDCLRNDYTGTGYIDGGRKQITGWLQQSLYDNVPYDEFVRQLVAPTAESEGFIKGIVWRGVVNASQTPPVQAAQNVSQIFLGINLKCASCHDSFISDWKLTDAYGLAGVFADEPLEMHRCDKPIGEFAPLKFLYPELGAIDSQAPRAERQRQVAALLTSPQNGRFARTIVNRLWARLLGRGFVEPVDEMDNPPWSADLLDWLADDFVQNGYDVKQLLLRIVTSQAYQLPSVGSEAGSGAEFVFRGPEVRRMSAEQFVDAISALTGSWQATPATAPILPAASPSAGAATPSADDTPDSVPAEVLKFRSGVLTQGEAQVDVDVRGARTLWLIVGEGEHGATLDWAVWAEPTLHGPAGATSLPQLKWKQATSGYGKVQLGKNVVEGPLKLAGKKVDDGIGTHATSVIVYDLPPGTERFTARVGPDDGALAKSKSGHELEFFVLTDVQVRAALVAADPLMRALGRQNREQVLTHRPSLATTLEALELTNGTTLDGTLKQGAAQWLAQPRAGGARELITSIFERALNREPTDAELTLALELVGENASAEGVEDLLWSIAMLPEFQLIY
ncbi:MAG: DUF1549 domain-containing protein [Planctomycetaceae bacterium]|nr:DUF1549 domain-containing protein [Planctomycetaceae bacterium]